METDWQPVIDYCKFMTSAGAILGAYAYLVWRFSICRRRTNS